MQGAHCKRAGNWVLNKGVGGWVRSRVEGVII